MGDMKKLGTVVRLSDGRLGTVVYNGLDGVGIKWGEHDPDPKDFSGSSGNTVRWNPPADWPWQPDAMLREPYPHADLPCVGEDYEIVRVGRGLR